MRLQFVDTVKCEMVGTSATRSCGQGHAEGCAELRRTCHLSFIRPEACSELHACVSTLVHHDAHNRRVYDFARRDAQSYNHVGLKFCLPLWISCVHCISTLHSCVSLQRLTHRCRPGPFDLPRIVEPSRGQRCKPCQISRPPPLTCGALEPGKRRGGKQINSAAPELVEPDVHGQLRANR